MRKINKSLWLGLGLALFLVVGGLSWFGYSQIGKQTLKARSHSYVRQMETSKKEDKVQSKEKGEAKEALPVSYDTSNIQALTTADVIGEQPTTLQGIGVLTIPDLNIELPIFEGIGGDTMMYGVGTAKPNQKMGQGNYALASHTIFNEYTGVPMDNLLLGNLRKAQVGQEITVKNQSKSYTYSIDKVDRVHSNQGNIINDHNKKKEITLYTCTSLTGDERLVVHGQLTNVHTYNYS